VLSDIVGPFYRSIDSNQTSKLKSDKSVFTIADGIVQHLLTKHLFVNKFSSVVGEEDGSTINIVSAPYFVDDLTVPDEFTSIIDDARIKIEALGAQIHPDGYKELSVFIDPIDGTREFSTGLGEQCSICIGFSDANGRPVAGVVFRPLTSPLTYACGAASEGYIDSALCTDGPSNPRGLLTSNGSISPFIGRLIEELGYERVPSGGAGNKMLFLLEGRGGCYIQDRGVSRWDTCGAQAVIEAYGGTCSKLTKFVADQSLESYTYLRSDVNLDYEPGVAYHTPYNSVLDKEKAAAIKQGQKFLIEDASHAKPYSNLCGLFALDRENLSRLSEFHSAIQRAMAISPPAYD